MNASNDSAPLGFLGGTFDPIHFAHLRLAMEARDALGLAQVGFIPAGSPPHRDQPRSTAQDRLNMVKLATQDNPCFFVDDSEVLAAGKSYTVHTLERLRSVHGLQRPLVLILGADAFNGLASWHRWQELFELAHFAVANRPGYASAPHDWTAHLPVELAQACSKRLTHDPLALRGTPSGLVIPFTMPPLALSATHIRDLLHNGRSARYLLPDTVLHYIEAHQLYR